MHSYMQGEYILALPRTFCQLLKSYSSTGQYHQQIQINSFIIINVNVHFIARINSMQATILVF